jgi:hypothetical protein
MTLSKLDYAAFAKLNKLFKENEFYIKFWQNKLKNFQLTVKHILI